MELLVNGKSMQLTGGTTAAQLLQRLGIEPGWVVVEINLNIVKRAQLDSAVLQAGDQVEIVHFVGGGSVEGTRPVTSNQNTLLATGFWLLRVSDSERGDG